MIRALAWVACVAWALKAVATSRLPALAAVSDPADPGLVIAVSEMHPLLAQRVCPVVPASPDDVGREQRGDWMLDSAVHRGAPRKFWYNANTHESRWADKFKPPKRPGRAAPAAAAVDAAGRVAVPGLRRSLEPLIYDAHNPVCVTSNSRAFVRDKRAPQNFCAHHLGIVPNIMRRRIVAQTKGLRFDQFVLEHALLRKWLDLAALPCDGSGSGGGGGAAGGSTGSKRGAAVDMAAVCSAQLAVADVVVVPSLVYHCTPLADHGFMNKVLKAVLTPAAHEAFWNATREAYYDPYLRPAALGARRSNAPPLVVVAHRFVWDLPHFREMLHALVRTQPPGFAGRVIIPGLESSLLPSELALFPEYRTGGGGGGGWGGFVGPQLDLRRRTQAALREATAVAVAAATTAPGGALARTPPLLVPMPYPLPVLEPVAWHGASAPTGAVVAKQPGTVAPLELGVVASSGTAALGDAVAAASGGRERHTRPIFALLHGDGAKPAPGRRLARDAFAAFDPRCRDPTTSVCWVCDGDSDNGGGNGGGSGGGSGRSRRRGHASAEGADTEGGAAREAQSAARRESERAERAASFRHPVFEQKHPPERDRWLPAGFIKQMALKQMALQLAAAAKAAHPSSSSSSPPPPPPPKSSFAPLAVGSLVSIHGLKLAADGHAAPADQGAGGGIDGVAGEGVVPTPGGVAPHPLQEFAGHLGQVLGPARENATWGSGGGGSSSSGVDGGKLLLRVLLARHVWVLPRELLVHEPDGGCGRDRGVGSGALRHDHVWRLASASTFCVEPAGDTPTRSHLYLAVLSGCVPVVVDGGAPSFGRPDDGETPLDFGHAGHTPWAWRRDPAAGTAGAADAEAAASAWENGGFGGSWPELDYRRFAVTLRAADLNGSFASGGDGGLVAALRRVSPTRLASLRRGLEAVAPLMRYAPHGPATRRTAVAQAQSWQQQEEQGTGHGWPDGQDSTPDAFTGLLAIVREARRSDGHGNS